MRAAIKQKGYTLDEAVILSSIIQSEVGQREDMLKVLQEEEYGFLPPAPEDLTWEIQKNVVPRFCGNKATYDRVTLRYTLCGKTGEFPVSCVIPNKPGKHPFFVMPNFRADVPDRFMCSLHAVFGNRNDRMGSENGKC